MKHLFIPLALPLLLLPCFAFAQGPTVPELNVSGFSRHYCTNDTIQFTVTTRDTYSISIIHICGQDSVPDTTIWNNTNVTIRIPAPSTAGDYNYCVRLFDSLINGTVLIGTTTIHPRLDTIKLYNTDPINCCGRSNSIISNINNTNFFYQWSYSVDNEVWTTIANENTPVLDLTSRNHTGDSIRYSLHVWDGTSVSCANGYDSICIHTYDTLADEITITIDTSITPRLLLQSIGNNSQRRGYQYQWQNRHDSTETWTPIDSSNSTSFALTLNEESLQYRLRITSPCDTAESNIISSDAIWDLYGIGIFVTGAVLGDSTVCHGESPSSLRVRTLPSSLTNVRYVWLKKAVGDSDSNWDSCGTGTTYYPHPAISDTMYKVQIKRTSSNLVLHTTSPKTIHVFQLTKPHIAANKDTTCSNINPNIALHIDTLAIGELPTTYQWQNKSINDINWVDISSATDTLFQLPQLTSSTLYRVKATTTATTCSSYSDSLTITVLPKLNINTLTIEIDTNTLVLRITNGDTLSDILPYMWQYRIGDTGNWTQLGTSKTHQLTLDQLDSLRQYRLKIMTPCDSNIESNTVSSASIWGLFYVTGAVLGDSVCYGESPSSPLRVRTLPSSLTNAQYVWLKKAVEDSDSNWDSCGTGTTYYPHPAISDTMYKVQIRRTSSNHVLYTTSPKTIHVRPQLTTPTLIPDYDTICHNSIVSISIDSTTVNNSYNYQWQKKNNHEPDWVNAGNGTSLTETLAETTQYHVIATDNAGCQVSSKDTTINVLAPLNAGSLEDGAAVCYQHDTTIQFATPPSGAGGNYSYSWKKSLDNITYTTLVDTDPTRTSFETGPMEESTFYKAVVTSNRCHTTDSTPPIQIIVWKIQPATVNTDKNSLCEGDSARLYIASSTSGGSGDYAYQWQQTDDTMSAINISDATDTNFISEALYTTTYFRVKCTDNNCPEQEQYSNWQKIEVNALPINQELKDGYTDNFCTPDTITYTLNYNNTSYQYSWTLEGSNGQILSQDQNRNEVTISWDKATESSTSLLKLTTTDRYTNCKRDNEFTIHLNSEYQRPEETLIKQKGANILICADSTNTAHYLWGMKKKPPYTNEIIPDSTWNRRYYQFKDFNTDMWNYFVEIYYAKGKQCMTRTYYLPSPDTSHADNASTNLTVSPNPSQGEVTYTLNQSIDGDCMIQIFDATGHLVYTQENTGYEADTPIKIETQLKQGIYILSLTSEKIMLNKKIIVQ